MSQHHATKEQRRDLAERMKSPDNPLNMVIACDMWITLKTPYPRSPIYVYNPLTFSRDLT
jgi:type I restriction enzyme R subunit